MTCKHARHDWWCELRVLQREEYLLGVTPEIISRILANVSSASILTDSWEHLGNTSRRTRAEGYRGKKKGGIPRKFYHLASPRAQLHVCILEERADVARNRSARSIGLIGREGRRSRICGVSWVQDNKRDGYRTTVFGGGVTSTRRFLRSRKSPIFGTVLLPMIRTVPAAELALITVKTAWRIRNHIHCELRPSSTTARRRHDEDDASGRVDLAEIGYRCLCARNRLR